MVEIPAIYVIFAVEFFLFWTGLVGYFYLKVRNNKDREDKIRRLANIRYESVKEQVSELRQKQAEYAASQQPDDQTLELKEQIIELTRNIEQHKAELSCQAEIIRHIDSDKKKRNSEALQVQLTSLESELVAESNKALSMGIDAQAPAPAIEPEVKRQIDKALELLKAHQASIDQLNAETDKMLGNEIFVNGVPEEIRDVYLKLVNDAADGLKTLAEGEGKVSEVLQAVQAYPEIRYRSHENLD